MHHFWFLWRHIMWKMRGEVGRKPLKKRWRIWRQKWCKSNQYIISWMLHQIFMLCKLKLQRARIIPKPFYWMNDVTNKWAKLTTNNLLSIYQQIFYIHLCSLKHELLILNLVYLLSVISKKKWTRALVKKYKFNEARITTPINWSFEICRSIEH